MRVSGKLKREVVGAVNDAMFAMLDEHCPSSKDCPPDEWSPSEKHEWDLITETGRRIEKRLEDVFAVMERTVSKKEMT